MPQEELTLACHFIHAGLSIYHAEMRVILNRVRFATPGTLNATVLANLLHLQSEWKANVAIAKRLFGAAHVERMLAALGYDNYGQPLKRPKK